MIQCSQKARSVCPYTEKQRFARQGIRCDSDRRQVDGQIGMEEAGCAK